MWGRLFKRFEQRGSLQARIRDMLAQAVHERLLAPGARLPSTRALAQELGVSRLTVTLALQYLCESGLIVAHARSGYRVSVDALRGRAAEPPQRVDATGRRGPAWEQRFKVRPTEQRNIAKPAHWQQLPYPFIYGQFDASLFPLAQWRECALESMHVGAIRSWAPDHIDRDHEPLIEQIQQRLLPARGIWAQRDEILVTAGAQQAMHLLAQVLVGPRTVVGIENPGYPDARNNLLLRSAALRPLPVDDDGLVVGPGLAACRYVYVTPSHQCPTTVTMSLARRQKLLDYADRHDIVLIEDDHESELNFLGQPSPALKSMDVGGRVIYVGSLSKTLAHGLRIGYVVAPARLICELRAMRRLMLRHPATNNEYSAALFIAHGFHEAFMRKLNAAYRERGMQLLQALGRYMPAARARQAQGGSAVWVEMPERTNTRSLAERALREGIVIEPGDVFFHAARPPSRFMRLGYSSIPTAQIAPGIAKLAALVQGSG
ncbi:PLP-dependent aminotransferase family protein [Ramlibacter tataouinensis]|uniref:Bifunctional protein (MocR family): transcriptional regulator, GntR family aspartate transaminase-like protein n=1 Tax=Ramlibacter tataouinensis (strain ATCC BAA-407 / DSM 14655 / LMG 21543 / TTB310) TaxID=365046 RepID=F5Y4H5_RAMTT|nr:PLP-dependent aminotransferase family protein [Ramlibacter tataouinensis]AEG93822.1 bifunctional protein (MocR family) : transcriptional regulator, GntR family; aspartate transaminase-like protein [Ramlibacter tataouinensis TTB310]